MTRNQIIFSVFSVICISALIALMILPSVKINKFQEDLNYRRLIFEELTSEKLKHFEVKTNPNIEKTEIFIHKVTNTNFLTFTRSLTICYVIREQEDLTNINIIFYFTPFGIGIRAYGESSF